MNQVSGSYEPAEKRKSGRPANKDKEETVRP